MKQLPNYSSFGKIKSANLDQFPFICLVFDKKKKKSFPKTEHLGPSIQQIHKLNFQLLFGTFVEL